MAQDKKQSIQNIQDFYKERKAAEVVDSRHSEQLDKVASLESTVVALSREFIKYLSTRTAKTEVVNFPASDTGKVVDAVKDLEGTVAEKHLELQPIAKGLQTLLEAIATEKRTPAVELHFDKGVNPTGDYKDGKSYRAGDAVTFEGQVFVATQDTTAKPGAKGWQLFVPRGDQGLQGIQGVRGEQGPRGETGLAGKDGREGKRGPTGLQGMVGPRGLKGDKGDRGEPGPEGKEGPQGATGVGFRGLPGPGVAAGGTTGQVLAKSSNEDYETHWISASGSGDMLAAVYDPTNVAADAFDVDNHVDGTTNKVFTGTEQTKLAGIEANADVTDATNVEAAGAVMNSDTSTADMSFVVDEDDMVSDSATKVPSQQSVKAYVDAQAGGSGIDNVVEDTSPELGGDLDADGYDIVNVGHLIMDDTIESPFLLDLADGDTDYEYGIGRSDTDKSWSGRESQSFHIKGDKSYMWFSSGWTKLMELVGATGALRILGSMTVGAYTLTASDGSDGQVLTTDGSGNVTWETPTGGGISEADVVALAVAL